LWSLLSPIDRTDKFTQKLSKANRYFLEIPYKSQFKNNEQKNKTKILKIKLIHIATFREHTSLLGGTFSDFGKPLLKMQTVLYLQEYKTA
jgi:hypothetical protein